MEDSYLVYFCWDSCEHNTISVVSQLKAIFDFVEDNYLRKAVHHECTVIADVEHSLFSSFDIQRV